MRRWRLVAAATVSSGVLAGGMFAAFNLTASAATNTCSYTGLSTATVAPSCTITNYTISNPLTITFGVNTTPGGVSVTVAWSLYCTDSVGQNTSPATTGTETLAIPSGTTSESNTFTLQNSSLPLTDAASCTFNTASATEVTATPSGGTAPPIVTALGLTITNTSSPVASPTPSPTPTTTTSTGTTTVTHYNNQVHGFDGTCLDDKGNKSAKRTAVILWSCNNTDQAQGWTFSGSELKIHGVCLNAKGNGKQGAHLILWTCNGAGNEIFTHRSNGEFAEKANGYKYCIDDPGYATKNGTQPIMYTCNNGANQHFTKP
jgi:Ricin-type beta-trefoil lectin domain